MIQVVPVLRGLPVVMAVAVPTVLMNRAVLLKQAGTVVPFLPVEPDVVDHFQNYPYIHHAESPKLCQAKYSAYLL